MRKIVFVLILVIPVSELTAQDKPGWQVDFRTDVYSSHLWRGAKMGDAPAIEPEISLTKNKFGFTVWGATTFNGSFEEFDLIVNYQLSPTLNVILYDYYNPVEGEKNEFWKYSGDNLRHTIDLVAEFSCKKLPVSLLSSVFLYGDKDIVAGKEQFSTYIEPSYNFRLAKKDFSFFAGFTPFSGYYASNFAFVNLGLSFNDSFPLGDKLEMPVDITFCTNPYTNEAWFVVGIGLKTK